MDLRLGLACMLFKIFCLVATVARIAITEIPVWPAVHMRRRVLLHVLHTWDSLRHTVDIINDTAYLQRLSRPSSARDYALSHAPLVGLLLLKPIGDPLWLTCAFVGILFTLRVRMFRLLAPICVIAMLGPYDDSIQVCMMMLIAFFSGSAWHNGAAALQEYMLLSLTITMAREAQKTFVEAFISSHHGPSMIVPRDGFWTALRKVYGPRFGFGLM